MKLETRSAVEVAFGWGEVGRRERNEVSSEGWEWGGGEEGGEEEVEDEGRVVRKRIGR